MSMETCWFITLSFATTGGIRQLVNPLVSTIGGVAGPVLIYFILLQIFDGMGKWIRKFIFCVILLITIYNSAPLFSNWCHNLDLRCDLLSELGTDGRRVPTVPTKIRLVSGVQQRYPQLRYAWFRSQACSTARSTPMTSSPPAGGFRPLRYDNYDC